MSIRTLPIYQIDAFTSRLWGGNPAALVPVSGQLSDGEMQAIAAENNLSETAFFAPAPGEDADYWLRWFTPAREIQLCGHATLATAWLLLQHLQLMQGRVSFSTRSGILLARDCGDGLELDLPARPSAEVPLMPALASMLGDGSVALRDGANLMAIFERQSQIEQLQPDFTRLRSLHPKGIIVTAPGDEVDVVSRYFAPSYGIDEDPVTGSAHCDLAPYWCARLGRKAFLARQLSARGGEIAVRLEADRVYLRGDCCLYLSGEIRLP